MIKQNKKLLKKGLTREYIIELAKKKKEAAKNPIRCSR